MKIDGRLFLNFICMGDNFSVHDRKVDSYFLADAAAEGSAH